MLFFYDTAPSVLNIASFHVFPFYSYYLSRMR